MNRLLLVGVIFGMFLVFTAGCGSLNPVNAITESFENQSVLVERDEAKQLEVDLEIGAGKLLVTGGADDWLSGELEYNSSKLSSKVDYDLNKDIGKVSITQKNSNKWKMVIGEWKNSWDIQLTDDVPIDLKVTAGASDTSLDLRGVQLSDFMLDAGVGNIEVDLSGERKESFDTTIKTGVGETSIILPEAVGVKVTVQKGVGSTNFEGFISDGKSVYVNEAFETADVIIDVKVELGVGEANFKLK